MWLQWIFNGWGVQIHARIYTHTHTRTRGNGNIISMPVWLLDWSSGESGLYVVGVMLSVKDTVEVRQPATLAFTPSSPFFSLSSNRALRIVLAVRRDSYHHLSPRSLHLHHRPPRTAWPWITGAVCTQRGPSRAPWKPAEQRTAPPTLPTASAFKWVPASSSACSPHQVFALRGRRERECGGICGVD